MDQIYIHIDFVVWNACLILYWCNCCAGSVVKMTTVLSAIEFSIIQNCNTFILYPLTVRLTCSSELICVLLHCLIIYYLVLSVNSRHIYYSYLDYVKQPWVMYWWSPSVRLSVRQQFTICVNIKKTKNHMDFIYLYRLIRALKWRCFMTLTLADKQSSHNILNGFLS